MWTSAPTFQPRLRALLPADRRSAFTHTRMEKLVAACQQCGAGRACGRTCRGGSTRVGACWPRSGRRYQIPVDVAKALELEPGEMQDAGADEVFAASKADGNQATVMRRASRGSPTSCP